MLRRSFLALCAAILRAETKPPIYALLSSLASYLSDGNAPGAMSAFAKSIPHYQIVETNVGALTAQADMICDIELLEESGDEIARAAQTHWFLQIKSKQENGPTERREQDVKLTFAKQGKSWKITSIEPASILDPLRFT